MNEFKNASNHSMGSQPATWLFVLRRALQQSTWRDRGHNQMHSSEAVKPSLRVISGRNILIALAAVLLVVIIVPIALIIRAESHRPHYYRQGKSVVARGESLLGMNQQASAKPKPSPYKYTLATPITKPSTPIVFTPPRLPNSDASLREQAQPSTQPQYVTPALPQTATSTPPPPPNTSARAPFTPIVYPARHDKHFGGCSGQLTLNSGGLNFRCADDPGDSIQVGLNEIGALDDNGIQTTSGKKYHFTISGMSKPAAQQLFANWLHQVR